MLTSAYDNAIRPAISSCQDSKPVIWEDVDLNIVLKPPAVPKRRENFFTNKGHRSDTSCVITDTWGFAKPTNTDDLYWWMSRDDRKCTPMSDKTISASTYTEVNPTTNVKKTGCYFHVCYAWLVAYTAAWKHYHTLLTWNVILSTATPDWANSQVFVDTWCSGQIKAGWHHDGNQVTLKKTLIKAEHIFRIVLLS